MNPINQKQDTEQNEDFVMDNYEEDDDFDEAFKNLLRPIEMITRANMADHVHLDLIKELDSYLNYLKIAPGTNTESANTFVEAALMIQNVNVIYQKKVDEIVDDTLKLITKFQAYRTNKNGIEDVPDNVEDKKKKREKKFYAYFEPIEIELAPMKIFDCKNINVTKLQPLTKFVLNTNIKITNKYNGLLPLINTENGENIGKKYDFKMSGPVNCRLVANDSTHCFSKRVNKKFNYLTYLETNDQETTDLMDEDDEEYDEFDENCPEPAVFDQTITGIFGPVEETEEVCVANAMAQSPAKLVDANKVFNIYDSIAWASVKTKEDNFYKDKPFVKKKISKRMMKANKKNDKQSDDEEIYLPTYIPGETGLISFMKMKPNTPDPAFKDIIRAAQRAKRSALMKLRHKQMKESVDKSEPEECGSNELEIPVDMGNFDNDYDNNMFEIDDEEEPVIDHIVRENIFTYRKSLAAMKKFEQDEEEMAIEHLEMLKRVHAWHEKLRPILDEEEENGTDFDVHEYGTRMLNSFTKVGEQKTFLQLFGGMEKEEVSRYFLSILMLTNTHNFKIIKPANGEINAKTILELLKKERHHETLQVNVGNQVNKE